MAAHRKRVVTDKWPIPDRAPADGNVRLSLGPISTREHKERGATARSLRPHGILDGLARVDHHPHRLLAYYCRFYFKEKAITKNSLSIVACEYM